MTVIGGDTQAPLPEGVASATSFERFGRLLAGHLGLDVASVHPHVQERVLQQWADAERLSIGAFLDRLDQRPSQVAHVARSLFGSDEDDLDVDGLIRVVESLRPWPRQHPLRAWMVGFGGGEPVFRFAMELALRLELSLEVLTLFATDLDATAVAEAGRARVSSAFAKGLPAKARQWLDESEAGFVVQKALRSRLAFAVHDLLRTPPFGRIDVLVCRRTLPYLTPEALRHALERISFAIKPGGVLAVHPRLRVEDVNDAFEAIDLDLGLYRRATTVTRPQLLSDAGRRTRLLEKALAASFRARRASAFVVDGSGALQSILSNEAEVLSKLRGRDPHPLAKQLEVELEGPYQRALRTARDERRPALERGIRLSDGRVVDLMMMPMELEGRILVELAVRPPARSTAAPAETRAIHEEELARVRAENDEAMSALAIDQRRLLDELRSLSEENESLRDANQELEGQTRELQLALERIERRFEAMESVGTEADTLFEDCDVAALFIGNDNKVWRASSAVRGFLGSEPEVGDAAALHQLGPEVVAAVTQAQEEAEPTELASTIGHREVLVRVLPQRHELTLGQGVVVTLTDLSRVWRQTNASEAQARQLASLFETANDPTVELSLEGQITYANAAARSLLEVSGGEGETMARALVRAGASEPEAVIDTIEAARHGLRRPRLTVSFPNRGEVFDVTARPLYTDGRVARVVMAARDVTELDASQREVRASRALMQAVLDSLDAAIAVVDQEGRVVTHNHAWVRSRARAFPGSSAEQGSSFLEALDAEERAGREEAGMVATYVRSVLIGEGGGEPETCRYPVLVDGATRHLETFATRLSHAGQSLTVVVQNDVTSVKMAEQQRLEVQAKLLDADKLESLGVLAGGVAHDFNNLLVGILSNASFVLDQSEEGSVTQECLKDIELAADRAAELCQQLLAFSGRGQFYVEAIHLDVIVRDSIRLLQASINRTITLDVMLPERHLPEIEGDASQVRQVLFNLVTNAAEAISDSGTVRVLLGVEKLGAERIAHASHGDDARPGAFAFLRVTDDGAGMTREVRARIFEPFFTTKFTGRGLGLAAVQGIVHGHQGFLEVESEVGRGTTVTVFFPVRRRLDAPVDEEPGRPAILVVDDEEVVRNAATRALERAGFDVVSVASGPAGVEAFEREEGRFVLVLLDVTMPGMSGDQVYTRIRARSRSIPVLFSSGLPEMAEGQILTREARTSFIQKPYRSRDLVSRVQQILDEPQTGDLPHP